MNRHGPSQSRQKPNSTSLGTEQETLVVLLLRTAHGDREAFRAFYNQTSPRVYGLTRRTITDVELSQKTTQEIYLQVWQDAHTYDESSGSALAWLLAMAHRRAADNVRARQVPSNWDVRGNMPQMAELTNSLSPIQRESIGLAYYNCLTHREVAEHQSAALNTVKTGISSGLGCLRARLEEK